VEEKFWERHGKKKEKNEKAGHVFVQKKHERAPKGVLKRREKQRQKWGGVKSGCNKQRGVKWHDRWK